MAISLEFLDAAHGDSILVSWGDPPRLAVVDGGPSGTFDTHLGSRLAAIRRDRIGEDDAARLDIDLVVVTHVDDDHIAGIDRLLTSIRRRETQQLTPQYRIRRLWHNSFEELMEAAGAGPASVVEQEARDMAREQGVIASSINQGRTVRDLGRALGVAGNALIGGPVLGGASADVDGLPVRVAAPSTQALADLEKEWRAAKQQKDPSIIAAAFADRRVPNLSSICLVIDGPSGRALLTADARGDRLMEGLEAMELLPTNGTLHSSVLQVPHHGSRNNSDPILFERLSADHYVISTDGIAHAHPSPEVLDWIVDSRGQDEYTIHLTNPIPATEDRLATLAQGRNFAVNVRKQGEPGVVLEI